MSKSTASSRSHANAQLEEMRALLHEAEKALGETAGEANEQVHALRDRVRTALENGRAHIKDLVESAREHAGKADEVIRANPYTAIGIAAGVGALVGYLVSRKSS